MKRYPNPKLMMLVLALAVSLLAVAFGRLQKVRAEVTPNPICTMNPVVTNDFDNGAESLRQAVADACPGSTITFDLTGRIQLFGGNITIDKNLTIQGPGAHVLIVQNTAAQSATSRIFYVNAGVTATITGITISGGDVTGDGAGIYNNGTLTVNNSIITNNTMVGDGGGIYNNGTLTVIGSTISSNGKTVSSLTGISRVGGGIYNNGTLTVSGSTIHDNLSFPPTTFHFFIGGGIYNVGIANISNSTFSNNRAAILHEGGGAISNLPGGTLNVTDSIFDSNSGSAGGIFNFASTTNITNSTFTNNRGRHGGAIYSLNGAATVTSSTLSNNHIDNNFGSGGGGGGGIYIDFGTMTLTNSTVENNRSDGPISSFFNNGGGIYITNGTLNIANSTIANNTAVGPSEGGGIYRSGGPLGTVNSRNSIIAGNTAAVGGRDFFGTLNSQGYNLIGSTANTTITGVTTGNILNQDPLLLPLADNGGMTKTLALQPNSPAIDAGDSSGSTTDQRGAVRPSDQAPANVSDGADIGAFEFSPNTTITAHPADPSNSSSASFSFTVTNEVAFAGFQCNLNNSGFTACASPHTYNSLPDGSNTFTVRAVDNAGNAVGLQPSFTWTIDTTPPETTIDNNPGNPSAPNVGFRFSGTDVGTGITGFECDLDGGGFTTCTSPKTFNGLTQRSHTFRVRAIDAVGNVDPTPASFTWNVDRDCTTNPVVTSSITGDDGSLRLVVANACAGSTITFNVTGVITLSSGQITLDKNLTIQGPGAHLLAVRNTAAQSATSRVFVVNGGVTATISGLTITGGNIAGGIIPGGGGIYNNGTLTVTNSIISNNSASLGGGIYNFRGTVNVTNSTIENSNATRGGGIYNSMGAVNVTNSTINNNNVNLAGGGIYNDGFLTNGALTVTNSTISNNSVGVFADAVGGGGIYNSNDGTVSLTNATITNNSELAPVSVAPSFGGGINNLNGSTVNCRNTIIAGNTGSFSDFAGTLTSQGYNLIGVAPTIVSDTTGNITGTNAAPLDPRLAPLVFNGGQTMTHALLSNSPAINAGNTATSPAADQRGAGRIGTADIGAFELNNPANGGNFVATLPDGVTGVTYSYVLSSNRGAWTYSMTGGSLPSGISLSTNGAIVSIGGTTSESGVFNFTVTGTDGVNSIVTDYSVQFVVPTVNNTAPGMTPAAAILRQQGSAAGAAVTVGTVVDAETAAGSLTVTQIAGGTATGINISGITNTDGTITAQLSADCNATAGTVRFQASDGSLTGTGDLQVDVSANSAPTLTYAAASVNGGGATTNSPTTATDNGSIASYAVQSTGTYSGAISVNSAGEVSISNAAPVGSHTITIRATDNCGLFTDASFTLTVNNTAPTFTPAAALSRQQGSPAGAAVTVGTVSDAETAAGSLTVTQIAGGTATGITISGITNTGGTITAELSADCNATAGTVRFQVSDGSLSGTGDLQVNVSANSAPALTYAAAAVNGNGATTNSPTTATDNGSIASYSVHSQGTYTGTISVNSAGVVSISNAAPVGSHTITIRATDNCSLTTDATFTLTVNNTAPTFTPAAAISRQQGSPAGSAVTVGTVSDAQTATGSLTVTQVAGGTATGITVTSITNTSGTITAQVSADCNASAGTVRFQVSDGSLTGTGNLQVNVTDNSAPTLTYASAAVNGGSSTSNSPATASDNGSISSYAVQSQGTYGGTISVNSAGVVSISNAAPVGSHTITIRATDNCGLFTDASFTLTVNNTAPTFTPAAAISRQQGSPAGAAVTVGTVGDAQTATGSLTVTQVAGGTATGITISSITNTNGTITAQVSADCNATAGTVRFQVSDGSLTGTGNLQVNVTANSALTLIYAAAGVNGGGATTNSPTTATDNGSIASYAVQSQGTYTGTISVNSAGVVSISNAAPVGGHSITIRATDNCGLFTDSSFTLTVNNTAPTFTPAAAISRQQGSPAGTAVTVGTVSDAQMAAGSLTVTQVAGGTATGITISSITNTNGTITAQVGADCNATAGTVRFQVSDGSLTGTGNLQVNVTANSALTLIYAAAAVNGGGATTNSPTTATDNGSITTYAVQSQGTYTGTISVNSAGVVSISNAAPVGSHTITIRATDNCGLFTDATFTLTVNAIAHTPSVTNASTSVNTQTTSGLVISRNAADSAEVTNFKITNILNGTLLKNDGTTPIANNQFITIAEGNAGLKFTPASNLSSPATTFSFDAQASTTSADAGLGGSTVTATITVNHRGTLQFSAGTYNVVENSGPLVITVTRTGGTAGTATIQIASSNGTATAGTDYTAVSQTLIFNEGETSKTVNVPITDNLINQPNRTIDLTLSNVGGSGQLGASLTAVLTILDDDPIGGYIRFSAPTYNVGEGAGSATITVERLGTLSQPVTVDYATSDDSNPPSMASCDPTPGNTVASSRCDFNTAVGRLSFAASDGTPKTFTVLINQDTYLEGPETLPLTLSDLTGGATFATPSTATLTITDADLVAPTANTIDDAPSFVRQHYRDFLNREPDAAGLAFWTNQITSCGADAQCTEAKRVSVSAAFFLSIEFQVTGGTAYLTNKVAYGGLPNYLRFETDAQAIGRNYVLGQPGAEGILEANKVAYFNDYVSRTEFMNTYNGLSDQAYVNTLISNTGIIFTQLERDALLNGLASHTETRATVLRKVSEPPSFAQAEFNSMFVLMEYFGYLRRNPDPAGFNFWLNKLNQFNGNFANAEMVKAFINSTEYRQRFGR